MQTSEKEKWGLPTVEARHRPQGTDKTGTGRSHFEASPIPGRMERAAGAGVGGKGKGGEGVCLGTVWGFLPTSGTLKMSPEASAVWPACPGVRGEASENGFAATLQCGWLLPHPTLPNPVSSPGFSPVIRFL